MGGSKFTGRKVRCPFQQKHLYGRGLLLRGNLTYQQFILSGLR